MKRVLFSMNLVGILFGFIGCQTVPRHLVREEVVIIYYEPILVDLPPIEGPQPPDPPYTPITRPGGNDPIDRQQDKPRNDAGSYGQRDQLQGGSHRESGEIKSDPPVRKPPKNDRVQ